MQIILSVNKNIKNKKFKMKESHIEFDIKNIWKFDIISREMLNIKL